MAGTTGTRLLDAAPTRLQAQAEAAARLGLGSATWRALGTSARLLVTEPTGLPAAQAAVEAVLAGVDEAASRFRVDSELTRVNDAAGEGWQSVSPLLAHLLRVALDAAQWTDGLVDPTVGRALVDLGYDRTFRSVPPDGPPVTVAVQPAPGWQRVDLDGGRRRVRIPRGLLLDLGATAKGYAADRAAAAAAEAGSCAALVNLGGDLSVAGAPEGGWPVLITDDSEPELPEDGSGAQVTVWAGGLASSGTAARRWRRGGSWLHHLIDPRSGLPAAGPWRTVSVAASTCALANSASTAAVVLGPDAPRWLVDHGLTGRLQAGDGTVLRVGGWPA